MTDWPEWWEWEVDTDLPHLRKRELDRKFSDTELRTMLEDAKDFYPDHEPGRFVIEARHGGKLWHVIVEPDWDEEVLRIITAYKPDERS